MKFENIPDSSQTVAAQLLSELLKNNLFMPSEKRTEDAQGIAETVRRSFEKLFSD